MVQRLRERRSGHPQRVSAAENGKPAAAKNALGEWQPRRENLLQATAVCGRSLNRSSKFWRFNTMSGGDWTVNVSKTPFDAKERPALKFRYRVPKGVLVNLYALVDGKCARSSSLAIAHRYRSVAGVKPIVETAPPPWAGAPTPTPERPLAR